MTPRHAIDPQVDAFAIATYAYKAQIERTRVIEVPLGKYLLAALPAIILCIGLLIAFPNPVVHP